MNMTNRSTIRLSLSFRYFIQRRGINCANWKCMLQYSTSFLRSISFFRERAWSAHVRWLICLPPTSSPAVINSLINPLTVTCWVTPKLPVNNYPTYIAYHLITDSGVEDARPYSSAWSEEDQLHWLRLVLFTNSSFRPKGGEEPPSPK